MTKNLTILTLALLAVVGIIFGVNFLTSRGPSVESLLFFPKQSSKTIGRIDISENGMTVSLLQGNQGWSVGQPASSPTDKPLDQNSSNTAGTVHYPADSAALATAVEKIVSMKRSELISRNPAKQAELEVDSAKGRFVSVYDGANKLLGAFIIGKSGPDWSSNYVRVLGSEDVYLVGGSIKYAFFTEQIRWLDKRVSGFSAPDVQKISFSKKSGDALRLSKSTDSASGDVWKLTEPQDTVASTATVSAIVGALATLQATDYTQEKADSVTGFDAPELTIEVELLNGKKATVTIGKAQAESNSYYVRSSFRPAYTYLVSDSEINKFDVTAAKVKLTPEQISEQMAQQMPPQMGQHPGQMGQMGQHPGQMPPR
jgi:hypothetical protein